MPLALDFLAQRYSKTPWEIEDAPQDKVQWYMRVIGVYNEALADMEGLPESEQMYWEDDG